MKRTGKILTAVMAAALTVGLFFGTQEASAHHRHASRTCVSSQTCRFPRNCPDCGGQVSKGVCTDCHVSVPGQAYGHHGRHH